MRQQVNLFIEDREVEFSQPPQILYNYKETELRNPTIVKNSYSKSIEIEGTNTNNDIFGGIWQLDRNQLYGTGGGPSFNPSRRADFKLYVNSELYEKGYCKLDSIKKNGNNVTYTILLFGGIGSLFYNLQNRTGDNDAKLSLADLKYVDYNGNELDLDFTINKDTVEAAWEQLERVTDENKKWDVINFAFCSEGIPTDFSADRALYNNKNYFGLTVTSGDYNTVLNGVTLTGASQMGYSMMELKNELTMDTSFDLRSYLLRPVISVEKIFEAIKDARNNGGYEIKLDEHFFNNQNPYYKNAWLTLPRLKELNIEKMDSSVIPATLSKSGNSYYNVNFTKPETSENVDIILNVTATPTGSTTATTLYPATYVQTNLTGHNFENKVREFQSTGGLVICLEALDENGNVLRRGTPIILLNEYHSLPNTLRDLYDKWHSFDTVYGHFEKKNGVFVFCDENGNTLNIHTKLQGGADYSSIRLQIVNPYVYYVRYTKGWPWDKKEEKQTADLIPSPMAFYTKYEDIWTGSHTLEEVQAHNRVIANWGLSLVQMKSDTADYEGFFSGTHIPKEKLLATSFTPADFLLDYCKLFGLYFYLDPTETSDWPQYDKGVVHILDRNSFYTEEVVNINELIDRSKDININPRTAESKWYSFSYGDSDSEAEVKYKNNYGYAYGRQLVNTQSDFNSDVTELYDGSIFKNGIMVTEKNGYFGTAQDVMGAYMYDGFTYHLFKKNNDDSFDTIDLQFNQKRNAVISINPSLYVYYDCMPKLQVHKEGMEAGDGSGILLFQDRFITPLDANGNSVYYYITDDVADMGLLNDGMPCWLNTTDEYNANDQKIAVRRLTLPFFTRDIYSEHTEGNIIHSWNFGHPKETYVPRTYSTEGDGLYDKMWANYIRDLYNVNTKVVNASVRLTGKPNPSWLRRYYWWDNVIWRCNAITDWNVSTFDTTDVEFIKVNDMDNYKLNQITYSGILQILLDGTNVFPVNYSGGTVTGKVTQQSTTERWHFADGVNVTYANGDTETIYFPYDIQVSPMNGSGVSTNFTLTVPQNPSAVSRTFELRVEDSNTHSIPSYAYFTQAGDNSPYLDFAAGSKDKTVDPYEQTYILQFDYANVNPATITATSNSTAWVNVTAVDAQAKTITLAVGQSQMPFQRTATITLSGVGIDGTTNITKTTTFKQSGGHLDAYPREINLDYNSTSGASISITASTVWNATINDSNNGE